MYLGNHYHASADTVAITDLAIGLLALALRISIQLELSTGSPPSGLGGTLSRAGRSIPLAGVVHPVCPPVPKLATGCAARSQPAYPQSMPDRGPTRGKAVGGG